MLASQSKDKERERSTEVGGGSSEFGFGHFEFGVPVGQHSAAGLLVWSSERGLGQSTGSPWSIRILCVVCGREAAHLCVEFSQLVLMPQIVWREAWLPGWSERCWITQEGYL